MPDDRAEAFWEVTRENITTFKDLEGWWRMFRDGAEPVIDEEDRALRGRGAGAASRGPHDRDSWGNWTAEVKAATGRKGKALFMPLRKALTGQSHGPDMSRGPAASGTPGEPFQ